MNNLLTINAASEWVTERFGKKTTPSNISYLVQYGRIHKYDANGKSLVAIDELEEYFNTRAPNSETVWKAKLGKDINWKLSFAEYKESETTKHVHRLHPYKGKFIPQLVEYFLDTHTDSFKTEAVFQKGDVVLDPFCGSGTTLVQANELGLHAVGIDVSAFNTLISNVKVREHPLPEIRRIASSISKSILSFQNNKGYIAFDETLTAALLTFNEEHFPSPEFKRKINLRQIDERAYGAEKEAEFLALYKTLVAKYHIKIYPKGGERFLDKWFLPPVRDEIDYAFEQIKNIADTDIKKTIAVILSRTIRSCRATTHSDLGTLKEPVTAPYYCKKHGKICKPLFTISGWWDRYAHDSLERFYNFNKIRTPSHQLCLTGDSRVLDIQVSLQEKNPELSEIIRKKKIRGIFSSPPYVGLIDYHEQHAYAYDLFGFERQDNLEIGPLFKGQGKEAKQSYVEGIANVLLNCKSWLKKNYDVFLVANDKYGLYPHIAERAGMEIVNQYRRPVLNRVEKDRSAYAETIFHLKEKNHGAF